MASNYLLELVPDPRVREGGGAGLRACDFYSLISEVEMHARVVLWVGKGVLFRERCPQFRSVLIARRVPISLSLFCRALRADGGGATTTLRASSSCHLARTNTAFTDKVRGRERAPELNCLFFPHQMSTPSPNSTGEEEGDRRTNCQLHPLQTKGDSHTQNVARCPRIR